MGPAKHLEGSVNGPTVRNDPFSGLDHMESPAQFPLIQPRYDLQYQGSQQNPRCTITTSRAQTSHDTHRRCARDLPLGRQGQLACALVPQISTWPIWPEASWNVQRVLSHVAGDSPAFGVLNLDLKDPVTSASTSRFFNSLMLIVPPVN